VTGNTYNFGAGSFFAIPAGSSTPIRFGSLQESSVDFSASLKEAVGQYQYALAIGRGQIKVTGKAKQLQISAATYNSLFFNQTLATGATTAAIDEVGTVPAATPWTVNVANKLTWTRDLGVRYAATGLPLTPVASGPTVGQYSVAAGVYTFSTADAGAGVLLCYMYTLTTGYTITLANQLMGAAPAFMAIFTGTFSGQFTTIVLNSVATNKLTAWGTKLEDFTIPEFDFVASVDQTNTLGLLSCSS
jgi:hypothetical protein